MKAQGQTLSQEQLLEIGWRSAGVEVTDNSVRVMINKLRRALETLEVQDTITLIAITRSGYRMLIPEENEQPVVEQESDFLSAPDRHKRKEHPDRKKWKVALAGVISGLVGTMLLLKLLLPGPVTIDFVPWKGSFPGISPNTHIMVPKQYQDEDVILQTLKTYQHYTTEQPLNRKPANVLYLTTGSDEPETHQGVIACQSFFKKTGNYCESFYFQLY